MLLGRFLCVSLDKLLGMDTEEAERIIQVFRVGGACFELVEMPAMILAGRIVRAEGCADMAAFDDAITAVTEAEKRRVFALLAEEMLPVYDIVLSVNFWRPLAERAYGFVRRVATEEQPTGVDVYRMPASLYLRVRNDASAAQLIAKERCAMWELFAYIREYIMPANGLLMADHGAQEMEVFESAENGTGWAYMPVRYAGN